MSNFSPPDFHHLRAAQGWIELGSDEEAGRELDRIEPGLQTHPDVLELRWDLCARARRWPEALVVARQLVARAPDRCGGWIHLSYTLHELQRTQEAWDSLRPVAERFPTVSTIPYNLACYACRLGRLDDAREWLTLAMGVDRREHILELARKDPDLEPLWQELK